jgi:hypothetical protein
MNYGHAYTLALEDVKRFLEDPLLLRSLRVKGSLLAPNDQMSLCNHLIFVGPKRLIVTQLYKPERHKLRNLRTWVRFLSPAATRSSSRPEPPKAHLLQNQSPRQKLNLSPVVD